MQKKNDADEHEAILNDIPVFAKPNPHLECAVVIPFHADIPEGKIANEFLRAIEDQLRALLTPAINMLPACYGKNFSVTVNDTRPPIG